MAVGQGTPTRDIGVPDLVWGNYGYAMVSTDWWETSPDLMWPASNQTYAKMRHDPQLRAVLQAYVLPITRAMWAVDPSGCRDEVVQHVADDLGIPVLGHEDKPGPARRRGVIWARHLKLALENLIYGHMPFELRYRIDSPKPGGCHLDHLGERLPHTIARINLNRDATVKEVYQFTQDQPMPANRLLWYTTEHEGANWAGVSMLRAAYGAWLIKHEMWRVHGTSIRRFGMGVPYVEAPPGATAAQVAQARDLAASMRAGEQSGAGIPQGFRPMLMGLTGSVPDALGFIRYLDQAMAKMALAGLIELGHTQSGSRALGETFLDLFLLSLQAVADELAATATSGQDGMPGAVVDLVTQNWGEDEAAPRIVCTDVGEGYQVTAQALSSLVTAHALTPDASLEDWIRKTWRLPDTGGAISPLAKPPPPRPVSPGGNGQPGQPGVSPPASGSPAGQPPAAAPSAAPAGPGRGGSGVAAAGDHVDAGWTESLHPRNWMGKWMRVGAQDRMPGRGGMPGRGMGTLTADALADVHTASPKEFSKGFDRAFKGSPYAAFVNHYSPAEIKDQHMVPVMAAGGKAGLLVHDHGDGRIEATALFNTSKAPGVGLGLLQEAVDVHHVNYVEAFGPVLPKLYGKLGFKDAEVYPFDPAEAPAGWDSKRFDTPDYHTMGLPAHAPVMPAQMAAAGQWEVDPGEAAGEAEAENPQWWAEYGEEAQTAALVALGIIGPDEGSVQAAWAAWSEKLHPRDWHGMWTHVGGSNFTFSGQPGGGGHVRAIHAVADSIEHEPGGRDIAANLRLAANSMYRRDMHTAHGHLDGATYLDGIYRGGEHRDDIEAIRRSFTEVPKGVTPEPSPGGLAPKTISRQQGELKGKPAAPGLTGTYAGGSDWHEDWVPPPPFDTWTPDLTAPRGVKALTSSGRVDGKGTPDDPIDVRGNLDKALKLMAEGKHVRLNQPDEVALLMPKINKLAQETKAAGKKPPLWDFGLLTVKGTNLFTAQSKGIPRANMPQFSGLAQPGSKAATLAGGDGKFVDLGAEFAAQLRKDGVKVARVSVPVSHLRATQAQIDGGKVAGFASSAADPANGRHAEALAALAEPIYVTRDHYVIDGHHRWASNMMLDALDGKLGNDTPQNVTEIDMDIGAAIPYALKFAQDMGIANRAVGVQAALGILAAGIAAADPGPGP